MYHGKLSIRCALPEDFHLFAVVKAKAYADDREKSKPDPEHIPKWYNGEWYVGLGSVDDAEAKRLIEKEDFQCYIIMLDGIDIGIFWLHQEEKDSFTLEDFCILPEYQGNGYGKEALQLIEQLYPDNHRWLLTTPEFCKRNRHLYEKMGYKITGTFSEGTVIGYEKEHHLEE